MLRREHRTRRRGLRSVGGWLPAFAGWLAALSFLTVSCINEYPVEEPSGASVGSGLALRVSLLDAEGYGDGEGDDLLPPVERMHDLRVIITHKGEDGKEVLEYNRHIDFDDPEYAGKYRYGYLDNANLLFRVREGTPMKKHLYLFSNSEPVLKKVCEAAGLSKHPDPEEGVYGGNHYVDVSQDDVNRYLDALRDATFTQEELDGFVSSGDDGKANGIPMSAEYDVEVKPGNTGVSGLCVIRDLHLVRAANKITFTYINDRMQGDIAVTGWTLQNTAVTSYLLPRVPAADERNKSLFGAGTEYKGDWIAWYRDHIWDGGHADELNFEVPEGIVPRSISASYDGSAKVTVPREETVTGLCVPQRKLSEKDPTPVEDKATYYFLESRCISEETGGQQSYFISFNTLEYSETPQTGTDGNQHYWNPKRYPSGDYSYHLDQVKTLLRDTHVKITATFADMKQVNLDVSILNWKPRDPVEGQLKSE